MLGAYLEVDKGHGDDPFARPLLARKAALLPCKACQQPAHVENCNVTAWNGSSFRLIASRRRPAAVGNPRSMLCCTFRRDERTRSSPLSLRSRHLAIPSRMSTCPLCIAACSTSISRLTAPTTSVMLVREKDRTRGC